MFSGTEFGLYYKEENTKVEVKSNLMGDNTYDTVKILIDDKVYDSGKTPEKFGDFIFDCFHEPRGWLLQLGFKLEEGKAFKEGHYTLVINGTSFLDLQEAPERERASLARSKITYKMDGAIK